MKREGKAKMLRIHFSGDDKWQGRPLYEAIVERCRELGLAGATVFQGIEGYGASALIHRPHIFRIGASAAPILVQVIDTEEKIQKLLPVLDSMNFEGVIAISDVEVIRYTQDATDSSR